VAHTFDIVLKLSDILSDPRHMQTCTCTTIP